MGPVIKRLTDPVSPCAPATGPDFLFERTRHPGIALDRVQTEGKTPLRVMKFGGTSVGDASCIRRVIGIVHGAARDHQLVVVVSAMNGVTNRLIEAASRSVEGDSSSVASILGALRQKHEMAATELISSASERDRVIRKMKELFEQADHLCREIIHMRQLTPRASDSVSSLGERLSTPIISAALGGRGVASEAIEATELVVTDACHGAAEPQMDLTRERSRTRLLSLLQRGVVPVVTGFIGATVEGTLTTLGRGGSDYSATILGAALDADEIVIWKDVDGVLTADPRLVPAARIIPEISYSQAAELAQFGAKVLHPKTLRPVIPQGIPVRIRNTFALEEHGTKISMTGPAGDVGVRTVTAMNDVALITLGGAALADAADRLSLVSAAITAVRADSLLIFQSSPASDIRVVVPSALANLAIDALSRAFANELACSQAAGITVDLNVALVTAAGWNAHDTAPLAKYVSDAVGCLSVSVTASEQDSQRANLSFVVAPKDVQAALTAIHGELGPGDVKPHTLSVKTTCCGRASSRR